MTEHSGRQTPQLGICKMFAVCLPALVRNSSQTWSYGVTIEHKNNGPAWGR